MPSIREILADHRFQLHDNLLDPPSYFAGCSCLWSSVQIFKTKLRARDYWASAHIDPLMGLKS